MENIKYVFFDLDGTLTDPKVGITSSVAYAAEHYIGQPVADLDTLTPFIGPPLDESFMKYFGLTKAQAIEAVASYREYYRPTGIFQNTVYDGIPELLAKLKDNGITVVMATSKPEIFANQIADHYGFKKYFDCIAGSTLDGSIIKKADVIEVAIARLGITDRSVCVMVGDRLHDIDGARETGMHSVGVLYGYGSREELEEHEAEYIVKSVEELKKVLLF